MEYHYVLAFDDAEFLEKYTLYQALQTASRTKLFENIIERNNMPFDANLFRFLPIDLKEKKLNEVINFVKNKRR